MPLETATFLTDLNPANPAHSDQLNQDDAHMRLVKQVLKNTFPNFTSAALSSTQAEIDAAVGTNTNGTTILADAGATFKTNTTDGIKNPVAGEVDIQAGGVAALKVKSDGTATASGTVSAPAFTGGGAVPIGGTIIWWSDTLPTGYGTWAWCNGGTYLRSNTALFAILGTAYGTGDGATTAGLPDLRECVPVGKGTMGGATSPARITNFVTSTLGAIWGECLHLLGIGEIPAHTHAAAVTDLGHKHNLRNNGGGSALGVGAFTPNGEAPGSIVATSDTQTTGITVSNANTGGGNSHNNVQPSTVCNWIIRIA